MKALVNAHAFGGAAEGKLKMLEPQLRQAGIEPLLLNPNEIEAHILEAMKSAEPILLAGGDGTFHHGINQILRRDPKYFEKNALGLIGIGSSNSFLKSISHSRLKNNTDKIQINFAQPKKFDLGEITFTDAQGNTQKKYFLANASVGLLALGNHLFNEGSFLVRQAKRVSTEIANLLVFFQLLRLYKPINLNIETAKKAWQANFLSAQILKANYYTGGYNYPTKNSMDSGFFDLHFLRYQSRWQTLLTFLKLSLNRTENLALHESALDVELKISAREKFFLEADGELYESDRFHIQCRRQKILLAINL